ncbi:uncharacterized protein DNG_09993 [Cephalotrichum gorgonifer]|uniref:Uncharacterized protein n=1 Tax=Cephalotrichum gorgonifer TaxID=2041049 RepID=A0AAE8N7S7_9PEZI|nr:uncharacterized protein DNG_09993 [Cephalotrichum gorgonifer]
MPGFLDDLAFAFVATPAQRKQIRKTRTARKKARGGSVCSVYSEDYSSGAKRNSTVLDDNVSYGSRDGADSHGSYARKDMATGSTCPGYVSGSDWDDVTARRTCTKHCLEGSGGWKPPYHNRGGQGDPSLTLSGMETAVSGKPYHEPIERAVEKGAGGSTVGESEGSTARHYWERVGFQTPVAADGAEDKRDREVESEGSMARYFWERKGFCAERKKGNGKGEAEKEVKKGKGEKLERGGGSDLVGKTKGDHGAPSGLFQGKGRDKYSDSRSRLCKKSPNTRRGPPSREPPVPAPSRGGTHNPTPNPPPPPGPLTVMNLGQHTRAMGGRKNYREKGATWDAGTGRPGDIVDPNRAEAQEASLWGGESATVVADDSLSVRIMPGGRRPGVEVLVDQGCNMGRSRPWLDELDSRTRI